MLNFKRLGKVFTCLLLCAACLLCAGPVSALTTFTTPANSAVTSQTPVLELEEPVANETGHLASYVYYSARSSSDVIGCIEDGTIVTVLGTKGSYYKIDCYDMDGYIAKTQVQINEHGQYYVSAVTSSSDSVYLPSYSAQQALELKSQIVNCAQKYLGVPYVYGGTSPRGFDCSGFTQYVYKKTGIQLNRNVRGQLRNSIVISKEEMQPGDLVIFSNTDGYRFATHIGIYLGDGMMIHSGASRGICIVSLESDYFAKYFHCARRVILTDVSVSATMPSMGALCGNIGSGWRNEG